MSEITVAKWRVCLVGFIALLAVRVAIDCMSTLHAEGHKVLSEVLRQVPGALVFALVLYLVPSSRKKK